MIQTIQKEKTLLVDGPARINLLSGKASVLGAQVKAGEAIIVRKGKRIPLEALRNTKVELTLGDSASYADSETSSIPSSWKEAVDEILSTEERATVVVMGTVDCGKTSFCTYLGNSALKARQRVALIDGDLGQSDVGPPGTVSLAFVREPVVDPFRLGAEDLVFVGATSPSRKVGAIIDALAGLKSAAEHRVDLLIVNTDGWVEGDGAVAYKTHLAEAMVPNAVVAIRSESELAPVLDALSGVKVLLVDSPENVKKRDRETRRLLRESAYKKYLRDAKVRSFVLSWVQVEGDLGLNDEEEAETTEPSFEDRMMWLDQGDPQGILVALEDSQGKVLGFGTILDVDYERRSVRIYTSVEEAVSTIRLGLIRLDSEGNEIGSILESS